MMGSNRIVKFAFFLTALIMINGCTVVCYGLGGLVDTNNPEIVTIPQQEIITLRRESTVNVILVGGEEITGKFVELKKMLPGEYKIEYGRVKMMLQTSYLPDIGDTMELTITNEVYQGVLIGFDYGYIYVLLTGFENPKRLPLTSVNHIMTNEGTRLESRQLSILIEEGILPVMRVMVVHCPPHMEYILPHNIEKVQYYRKPNTGKFFGSLVGALLDILILTTK